MEENEFYVGDFVKEKGQDTVMKIISNVPGTNKNVEDYFSTDQFVCEWDEANEKRNKTFQRKDLTLIQRI